MGLQISSSLIALTNVAIVMVWILIIYALKYSTGCLNKILILKCWLPISKMQLSIYLIGASTQRMLLKGQLHPLEVKSIFHFVSKIYAKEVPRVYSPV